MEFYLCKACIFTIRACKQNHCLRTYASYSVSRSTIDRVLIIQFINRCCKCLYITYFLFIMNEVTSRTALIYSFWINSTVDCLFSGPNNQCKLGVIAVILRVFRFAKSLHTSFRSAQQRLSFPRRCFRIAVVRFVCSADYSSAESGGIVLITTCFERGVDLSLAFDYVWEAMIRCSLCLLGHLDELERELWVQFNLHNITQHETFKPIQKFYFLKMNLQLVTRPPF